MSDGIKGYWLRRWAAGEMSASDCLDRVRESGGTVTMREYAAMRRVDDVGFVADEYGAVESWGGGTWGREAMAEWAGLR